MLQANPDVPLPQQRGHFKMLRDCQEFQSMSPRHSTTCVPQPCGSAGTACQAKEQQCKCVGLGSPSPEACPGLCSNPAMTCRGRKRALLQHPSPSPTLTANLPHWCCPCG